jgi:hypothetical protein
MHHCNTIYMPGLQGNVTHVAFDSIYIQHNEYICPDVYLSVGFHPETERNWRRDGWFLCVNVRVAPNKLRVCLWGTEWPDLWAPSHAGLFRDLNSACSSLWLLCSWSCPLIVFVTLQQIIGEAAKSSHFAVTLSESMNMCRRQYQWRIKQTKVQVYSLVI